MSAFPSSSSSLRLLPSALLLLSAASLASAASCPSVVDVSPSSSTGSWASPANASSSSNTLQVLQPVASFDPSNLPSLVFSPNLTCSGTYSFTLSIPGCLAVGDCSTRTSLAVQIQPDSNASSSYAQTIPPSAWDEDYELFSGALQRSPAVTVSMSSTPVGVNGDEFSVVVGQLHLTLGQASNTTDPNSPSTPGAGSFGAENFLARGIVVVICMAIALGVVFLAVLIGLLIALFRRNRQPAETTGPYLTDKDQYTDQSSPSTAHMDRMDHIHAATEGMIAGPAATGGGMAALAAHERKRQVTGDVSEDEGELAGGPLSSEGGEDVEARVAHARWSLTPEPGAERELRIKAGQPYLILNDADPEWWLALDPASGEQGAVPASWML